jgi:hypothetical protein
VRFSLVLPAFALAACGDTARNPDGGAAGMAGAGTAGAGAGAGTGGGAHFDDGRPMLSAWAFFFY